MLNTSIEYTYRDGAGFAKLNRAVCEGRISEKQKERLIDSLEDGCFFVGEDVGLPVDRFRVITEDDHAFVEFETFGLTTERPTIAVGVEELVSRFEGNKGKWSWDMPVQKQMLCV